MKKIWYPCEVTRNEAYTLLTTYLHNKNLIKHCLSCEAAMKALYRHVQTLNHEPITENDELIWGITGLLHDVDYELAQQTNQLEKHGNLLFGDKEPKADVPEPIKHAIQAHNYTITRVNPQSHLDWAITCVDQLTGLIVACALVHPEKKLEPLTVEFVQKRFGEKAFAKGVDRTQISKCEEKLGIPLPEFIEITLSAMKTIHTELGL